MSSDQAAARRIQAIMGPKIESHISRVGWAVMFISSDDTAPSFAYTVGLAERQHPEIIVSGEFAPDFHQMLLNAAAPHAGALLALAGDDQRLDLSQDGYAVTFGLRILDPDLAPVNLARNRARNFDHRLQVVQLLIPDRFGRDPDDPIEPCEIEQELWPQMIR